MRVGRVVGVSVGVEVGVKVTSNPVVGSIIGVGVTTFPVVGSMMGVGVGAAFGSTSTDCAPGRQPRTVANANAEIAMIVSRTIFPRNPLLPQRMLSG